MKFSYKRLGDNYIRPIIPIGISFNGKTIRYEALVDSGADMCAFDAEIGEALGIDVESGREDSFGGVVGEKNRIFYHTITITIGGWPHTIEAGFSHGISQHGHGFLGQIGFFDNYIVQFNFLKGEIEVRNYTNNT